MYLKSLELLGFKSFVDSTKLEFPRGFTAVVGPNGCGKSNISDAIRWVIGEQSSKTLRGSKMEDLIFNGSESRKALGMAEVSMTIANLPKTTAGTSIPVLEEARVTRRYYRSGDSEYFINKTPCRLRDIIDLFLDTGISARAFSIIEQGHVNQLINSKPVDRRFIIEEAAGIMKYKHRRAEALKKMEAAQENLVRVNDTINELRRQLGSLKRQASKAEAYKRKKEELKDVTLSLYATDYRLFHRGFEEVTAELDEIRRTKEGKETDFTTFNNQMETLKLDITHKEKEINKQKEENFEMEGAIRREEDRIDLMKKQIEEVIADRLKAKEDVALMELELERVSHDLAARTEELDVTGRALVSQEGILKEKTDRLREIREELDQARDGLEEIEASLRDLNRVLSQQEHKRTSLQTRQGILSQREEKIHAEERELSGHWEGAILKEKEAAERLENTARELERQREKQKGIVARLEENRALLKELESQLENKKDAKSRLAARLASLEELQKNFEGFQEGARRLLKKREEGGESGGIRGILAEILETAPEFEAALETILGDRLQGLLMEDQKSGREALHYLKTESAGRGTFIPLSPRKTGSEVRFPPMGEGILGKALDLAKTSPEYQGILDSLLGDALIVKDLDIALSLWEQNNSDCAFVTLEGDMVHPQGTISGGSPLKGDSSPLRKKRMIAEWKAELSTLSLEMEELGQRALEKRNILGGLEREKSEIDGMIASTDRQCIHDEKDLHQIRDLLEKDKKRLETCRGEVQAIQTEKENLKREADAAEADVQSLTGKKEGLEQEAGAAKEWVGTLQDDLDAAKEEANEFNVQMVELKGKKENLSLDMERLRANGAAIKERMEKRKQNHQEAEEKKLRLEKTIESTEQDIIALSEKLHSIKTLLIEREEILKGLAEQFVGMEVRSRENTGELDALKEQLQEREVKKTELRMRVDNILQRLKDEYEIGAEELLREYTEETPKEEYADKVSTLKDQLSKFTDVNLGALEEYNVVNERHEFMSTQYNDLIASIADLNKAIEKINRTTSQRFQETFDIVNENFKMNFRRLFAGGRAEMILTHPDNLLETGIDITVQPPGKRTQNIIMLSAGEKAMTALSILFSVFMTKPSPFCLLDEVDAPLDEANINRFKEILRELSDKTQFIIITHNQMTMTFAETLYGVTMEEKGVSKVVSVNLDRKKKGDGADLREETEARDDLSPSAELREETETRDDPVLSPEPQNTLSLEGNFPSGDNGESEGEIAYAEVERGPGEESHQV